MQDLNISFETTPVASTFSLQKNQADLQFAVEISNCDRGFQR